MAEIYAPIVERTHISFELEPPARKKWGGAWRSRSDTHVGLVAESRCRIQGYAYAGNYREKPAYHWSTETTIYVRDGSRGKGIGRSLYAALLRILAAQNYRRAFGGIACRTRPASRCTKPWVSPRRRQSRSGLQVRPLA